MDLDTLIVAVYCLVEKEYQAVLKDLGLPRLRRRGPEPTRLTDLEVLTMELVGAYLGCEQDRQIFDYFRRHWLQTLFKAICRKSNLR